MTRARAWMARAIRSASGFTLIELLVAVGAVAFVAVGIASVFAAVGETVSRGRSVSALTAYAAIMERQMREDFGAMSREGFLLIRHEVVNEGEPVPLSAEQPIGAWRPRRADEIVFFTERPSRSAREPLAAGVEAEGSATSLYYGIGQRALPDPNPRRSYLLPDVTDENTTTMGETRLGAGDGANPNRFAGDWTLLRFARVLVQPGGGVADVPAIPTSLQASAGDSRLQIGLQPAADSLFRSVNRLDTGGCALVFPAVPQLRAAALGPSLGGSNAGGPRFSSGLVDIATTDLKEIRAIVQSSPAFRDSNADPEIIAPPYGYFTPIDLVNCGDYETNLSPVVGPVGVQQAWMLDALPASSHERVLRLDDTGLVVGAFDEPGYSKVEVPVAERTRMRYEDTPPDLHTALAEPVVTRRAIRMADQYQMTSSVFIPRCSEFIVEWSFGKTDDDGELIWHGAEREIDFDRDGTPDRTVLPYPQYDEEVRGTAQEFAGGYFQPYRLRTIPDAMTTGVGTTARRIVDELRIGSPIAPVLSGQFADVGDEFSSYPVLPELIHGVQVGSGLGTAGDESLVSYFGYTTPYFDPGDPDGDGANTDAALEDTLEWPWPELIRVTVTLVDPADDAAERTFQFVFPTPASPAP
ncbi:MAG: hypothetical protein AAFX79_03480 [Planctomycetota bacterium]